MRKTEDILNFDSNAKTTLCKKREIIQRAGIKKCRTYFVKKGLLRSYTIDEKGKEHVYMFASEGWIIADIVSQEFDQPAELFIDCLEDSEIILFEREHYNLSNLNTEQLKENANLLARRVATMQKRIIMLLSDTALKRYENFLETYPDLPNRIPQRMIASYLGITPQALSTIRGEMARKK